MIVLVFFSFFSVRSLRPAPRCESRWKRAAGEKKKVRETKIQGTVVTWGEKK